MNTWRKTLPELLMLALLWASAAGFINPNFTPVDLVKQSTNVVVLEIKNVDDKGVATAVVQKVLKDGQNDADKFKAKEIKIDLMAGITEADGKAVIERIKDGNKQIIMFVGKFAGNEEEGEKPADGSQGVHHLGGAWMYHLVGREGRHVGHGKDRRPHAGRPGPAGRTCWCGW